MTPEDETFRDVFEVDRRNFLGGGAFLVVLGLHMGDRGGVFV